MDDVLTVPPPPMWQPLPHAAGPICDTCWLRVGRITPIGATTRQDDQEHTCTHTEEENQ